MGLFEEGDGAFAGYHAEGVAVGEREKVGVRRLLIWTEFEDGMILNDMLRQYIVYTPSE